MKGRSIAAFLIKMKRKNRDLVTYPFFLSIGELDGKVFVNPKEQNNRVITHGTKQQHQRRAGMHY